MEAKSVESKDSRKQFKPTRITKLVLDGFKSFGKYTELLFGDDFNVIIVRRISECKYQIRV